MRWIVMYISAVVSVGIAVGPALGCEDYNKDDSDSQKLVFSALELLAREYWMTKERLAAPLDPKAYTHRELSHTEETLIKALLAIAQDTSRSTYQRSRALVFLGDHAHVSMMEDLAKLSETIPDKGDAGGKEVAQKTVAALARIADKRVIPHLIEVMGHPTYARVGACDLVTRMVGRPAKYKRKKVNLQEILKDPGKRKDVVQDFEQWWEDNKDELDVSWGAAWVELRAIYCD